MLTQQENELLTQVGPGTPMGDLLRRYWQPIAAVSEMADRWTKRIRIMGEDLVLFKDRTGRLGLIGEACPHRRASLAYGIPTAEGIRCPYHGWMFDGTGTCLEQPNEPPESTFKDKVSLPGYPVQELAGLVFTYMGPLPAPLITKLDGYVADPAIRLIGKTVIPCNWLQIEENSADPVHSEWLHGIFAEFVAERTGGAKFSNSGKHVKIAFDEVPYGIIKRRLKEGQSEDCSDWRVGHPLVWPNILAVGNADKAWKVYEFQIRVPEDDTHTTHFWFTAFVPPEGMDVPDHLLKQTHAFDVPLDIENDLTTAESQDVMAWATQGPIADRTLEHLSATDRGVTLLRRMLFRELKKIEAGEDPMLVNRDPAKDVPLDLPLETDKAHFTDGFAVLMSRRHWRYSAIRDELLAIFAPEHRHAEVSK
jgi:5,5'-dehydrodivanillate O-demethylase